MKKKSDQQIGDIKEEMQKVDFTLPPVRNL
jgi:hypothetical protein